MTMQDRYKRRSRNCWLSRNRRYRIENYGIMSKWRHAIIPVGTFRTTKLNGYGTLFVAIADYKNGVLMVSL
jgi:hypothetical protein